MRVWIVVEATGNDYEVDGYIIHRVFASRENAERYIASDPTLNPKYTNIEEHIVE